MLPVYFDYSFHKTYPQTLLSFAIFVISSLVANTISISSYFRYQKTSCVKYMHCVG